MANEKQARSSLQASVEVGAAFLVAGTNEIARLEAEVKRLKIERDAWEERYALADQTIREAADLLLADIIEDDVAIDALVLDAIGRVLTQRTNLILAVRKLGGVGQFAQCPCCLAERTNGERHDDGCPLVR